RPPWARVLPGDPASAAAPCPKSLATARAEGSHSETTPARQHGCPCPRRHASSPRPVGTGPCRMSILINKDTTVIIQGITGREAVNLTREGLDYGTKIVGGVTPGRGGRGVYGGPVYDCVRDITSKMHVDGSIVTVPPRFTRDAVFEAIEAGVKIIVIVTERIPRDDVAQMVELATLRVGATV